MRIRVRLFAQFCLPILFLFLLNFAQAAEETYPFEGEILADNINIRSDSTTSSEIVSKVNKGQRVMVLMPLYEWYKIKLPEGAPSYINKNLISLIDEKTAKVTKDNVNIRLRPDTKSAILGKAYKDEVINILSSKGEWYKIKPIDKSFAWINKQFVGRIPNIGVTEKKCLKAQEQEPEKIIISGLIKPKVMRSIATHKLISDNNEVFLLNSCKIELENFEHKRVKITAKQAGSSGKTPILAVEEVEQAE